MIMDTDLIQSFVSTEVFLALFVGGLVLFGILHFAKSKTTKSDSLYEDSTHKNGSVKGSNKETGKLASKSNKQKQSSTTQFSHPWSATVLKGHGASVLDGDFSPNGKYFISCSSDQACLMWSTKEFEQKEHKSVKALVDYDHATQIRFSPDSRAFIISLSQSNILRVFKIGKKTDKGAVKFEVGGDLPSEKNKSMSSAEIINIGIATTGHFIATIHRDTTIHIWSLKGELLHTIDTGHMYNYHGAVSPCGRFVASCGFTSDVKVWEVVFDKAASYFKSVRRAFELKGHTAGVLNFAFNSDSSRMASASRDMTWKFWDTNIDFQRGQTPYLLKSGSLDFPPSSLDGLCLDLSFDSRTVAISVGSTLVMCDTATGKSNNKIELPYQGNITMVKFDTRSRYVVTAGDKHLHVFHNIPGYEAQLQEFNEKLRTADGKVNKSRWEQNIKEVRDQLNSILQPTQPSS